MIWALILIPAFAGLAAFFVRYPIPSRALLVAAAVGHSTLTAMAWVQRPAPALNDMLLLDDLGLLFLSITSTLFLAVSVYAVGYLQREGHGERADLEEGFFFANAPDASFTACLLLFFASMTVVCVSQHFGLLWVAVEATTLASAPLIYFHRHHRSLEATWKYLMICSVGIPLALLGNFFLAIALPEQEGHVVELVVRDLLKVAGDLNVPWFKAAFLLLLVGYGTKMGLAPLHTWLPDAHSEAPSPVSAMLSGALLNCAFLGILRAHQVAVAAGQAAFSQELLVGFGLLSMTFAAVFIIGQPDYKRMLAYSSVEHMGILALGVGLGGAATFGAMLHSVNHSLTKGLLFLVAGNIVAAYRSKAVADVRGMMRVMPVSAVLWLAGFLAITGTPPFGPFLSEFTILKAALDAGRGWVAASYLILLGLIFVGMATAVLRMAQGEPAARKDSTVYRDVTTTVAPSAILACVVLVLGVYVPPFLKDVLQQAAKVVGQ